jgi:hypothetical protein
MTRKDILLNQLAECRNEMANTLTDLDETHLAHSVDGHNCIGWIVAHCMRNFDHFLFAQHTGDWRMKDRYPDLGTWASEPPSDINPTPDLTDLAKKADEQLGTAIAVLGDLTEEQLSDAAPHWNHELFESTASNCVRVINHTNAHLRQIMLVRGVLGLVDPWPVQTLVKDRSQERMPFIVPPRHA